MRISQIFPLLLIITFKTSKHFKFGFEKKGGAAVIATAKRTDFRSTVKKICVYVCVEKESHAQYTSFNFINTATNIFRLVLT